MARPTVFTKEALQKLEEAFALGCTDEEACIYANIAPSSLYNYQGEHPEFLERKQLLHHTPILKARRELIRGLEGNPELALKYLERKRKEEFSLKNIQQLETRHSIGERSHIASDSTLLALRNEYEERLRELYAQ